MTKTVWYFYDEVERKAPMQLAGPKLALQLALPAALTPASSTGGKVYIVFEMSGSNLRDPCKPRFTDTETLERLDYWKPGGRTAPFERGLTGLDEMVALPAVLKDAVRDFTILECDHI